MTEQELKDAIALACKTDYERVMAAPKHRFSRAFRKKIKELLLRSSQLDIQLT
jgi:hypothetical protein